MNRIEAAFPFPDLQRLSTRPILYIVPILYFPIVVNTQRLLCALPSSLTIPRDSIIPPDPLESVKNTVFVGASLQSESPINPLFFVAVLRLVQFRWTSKGSLR